MVFSTCCPARLQRLSLVAMLSCSSGLIAFGSAIGTSGVATARGAASPLSTAQPCEWQVSVPLRAYATASSATLVTLDRRASTSAHPTLVVSPTSKAIGGTVAIVGRQFNRSFGPITIRATIPESDMLFEVHGTTRIRVDAAGSFTSHLYLPYQIPAGHATLYAEQGGQVVAQTGLRVTAAVTPPPPMNPFSISRMQTFGPAGRAVATVSSHDPITVRTWWKTGYVDYITRFQFSVRVSTFHGHWHSFGLVGRGAFLVTYQKQFCFVLTPPTGTYSKLRVHLTLQLLDGYLPSSTLKQSRTVTIAVRV